MSGRPVKPLSVSYKRRLQERAEVAARARVRYEAAQARLEAEAALAHEVGAGVRAIADALGITRHAAHELVKAGRASR